MSDLKKVMTLVISLWIISFATQLIMVSLNNSIARSIDSTTKAMRDTISEIKARQDEAIRRLEAVEKK